MGVNKKISELTTAVPAANDLVPFVDVSDTAMGSAGSTRKCLVSALLALMTVPVSSVFGRTGAVVVASGDYSVGQVTGAAPLDAPTFTGTVTVGGAYPSNAQVVINSEGTYGVGGLRLNNNGSGGVVVVQAIGNGSGSGLLLTNATGSGYLGVTAGFFGNPFDGSTLTPASGNWVLNSNFQVTGHVRVPLGSLSDLAIGFTGQQQGFYSVGNVIVVQVAGQDLYSFWAGEYHLSTSGVFGWTASANSNAAAVAGLKKVASGVVGITDGSTGNGALIVGSPAVGTAGLTINTIDLQSAAALRVMNVAGATELMSIDAFGSVVTTGLLTSTYDVECSIQASGITQYPNRDITLKTVFAAKSVVAKMSAATATVPVLVVKGGATPGAAGTLASLRTSDNAEVFGVGPTGQIRTNQPQLAGTPGTVIMRLPIYDQAGTLLGYTPLYDDIS